MKKILLIILINLLFSSYSIAGSVTSKIKYVQIVAGGNIPNTVLIKFEAPPVDRPSCATDDRMVADLSTPSGKAILSIALAAKASGAEVFSGGSNSCSTNLEKILYIRYL